MKVTKKINVACLNCWHAEGYVGNIKYDNIKLPDGTERSTLKFVLESVNKDWNGVTYGTPFDVVGYRKRAEEVMKWIKDGQFVRIEARIRLIKGSKGEYEAVLVYAERADQYMSVEMEDSNG